MILCYLKFDDDDNHADLPEGMVQYNELYNNLILTLESENKSSITL